MYKYKSILLVEDDEDTLGLLKLWSARQKIASHIHAFNNASDAGVFIKTHNGSKNDQWPSLIILDIYLPGLTGFDFLKELMPLCQINPKPKIFLITGSEDMHDVKNAVDYDVDAFIKKPLNHKKLTGILMKVA